MTTDNSQPSLVGAVFERQRPPTALPRNGPFKLPNIGIAGNGAEKFGFPTVQHRSKSAFARSREDSKSRNDRSIGVPVVQPSVSRANKDDPQIGNIGLDVKPPTLKPTDSDEWRNKISEENEKRVEKMTDEEREQERLEILERFGAGIGDILRKAREARERNQQVNLITNKSPTGLNRSGDAIAQSHTPILSSEIREPTPGHNNIPLPLEKSSISNISDDRPSRSGTPSRRLRFADLTPNDVHVYESQPPSPRRQPLALLPPPDAGSTDAISLGSFKQRPASQPHSAEAEQDTPEEGTPEYIRRRFFPNAPAHDPSLAWIEDMSENTESSSSSGVRFDLSGNPIPPEVASTLPTHLGLHHHAGSAAGYTLDDLFLLSRSTVPAQRVTVLDVLAKIARHLAQGSIVGLKERREELRKRIVAAGIEALAGSASLGARAVQVIWECVVGWDDGLSNVEGVELKLQTKSQQSSTSSGSLTTTDVISTLPMEYLLPQITDRFSTASIPVESLSQLLSIIHRIAQHTNELASTVLTTPQLIPTVLRRFLPSSDPTPLSHPDPAAIQLLITLSLASRKNATVLVEIGAADAVLRFVTILPPASTYPLAVGTTLLVTTLRFYAVLASYGLYAHVATTAQTHFHALNAYVLSDECTSRQLMAAWAALREAWMACAIDPHRTTPDHEILWSQVGGWGWREDILDIRAKLSADVKDQETWGNIWSALAAWLEGARVNGVRAGEHEREAAISALKLGFEDGTEREVLAVAIKNAEEALQLLEGELDDAHRLRYLHTVSSQAKILGSALRLCLACSHPAFEDSASATPLTLPFGWLLDVAKNLLSHSVWSSTLSPDSAPQHYVLARPLSNFIGYYLRLTLRTHAIPPEIWLAHAFLFLTRLSPGDEELGQWVFEKVAQVINQNFMDVRGLTVPFVIWERGGLKPIVPFLVQSIAPKSDEDGTRYLVGPLVPSPHSIEVIATQRLPSVSSRTRYGLPVKRDWSLSPLDHLLRSGASPLFQKQGLLPEGWDASETEVVRASLLLARIVREIFMREGFDACAISRSEAVFGCMKVFMLEHGQQEDATDEVFRDSIVGASMEDLLAPFVFSASSVAWRAGPFTQEDDNLEIVAARFLGPTTPFFQYYTDFVSLYDSVSFSHPLFARLLLPPTSMNYALDYRKHLWGDFSHLLKTVLAPVESVVTRDIREWLWPVERDAEMIGWYVRALIRHPLEGFVRWIAVHHVACNIWHDLRVPFAVDEREELARKLLSAVAEQGGNEVVRDIVLYRQVQLHDMMTPPRCYEQSGDWKKERLGFVDRLGSQNLRRLASLLSA